MTKEYNNQLDELLKSVISSTAEHWRDMEDRAALKCLIEAIASGDFYNNISKTMNTTTLDFEYCYKPYQGIKVLAKENKLLREKNEDLQRRLDKIKVIVGKI